MASNVTQKAEERRKNRQRRERWNKLVTGMAAVVVFCTTYALILPAITLERKPTCGIEEHVHDDGCYGPPMVLSCGAGSKTAVLHSHNEFCYDTEGRLICTLPELQEHVHSDSCYRLVTPEPPHVHTDECWKETKTLTCTLAEGKATPMTKPAWVRGQI